MKRVVIICEGLTEREFCREVLSERFVSIGIHLQPVLIKKSGGGIVKWSVLKRQIKSHLGESDAYVTMLIDYYGIKDIHAFPGWDKAKKIPDKVLRIEFIEKVLKDDLDEDSRSRFIPYLQLHEFEGLLFNDINVFYEWIPAIDLINHTELKRTFDEYANPELINDGEETAPSKRLARIIKGYRKVNDGNIIALSIGLDNIRAKSPRFNNWLTQIEEVAKNN